MIRFNFTRVFVARGIERPYSFLRKAGISGSFSSRISKNEVARMNVSNLERLCMILHCTPNDLLEWTPEKDFDPTKKHPLDAIKNTNTMINISNSLISIPADKLAEIESLIQKKVKEE